MKDTNTQQHTHRKREGERMTLHTNYIDTDLKQIKRGEKKKSLVNGDIC